MLRAELAILGMLQIRKNQFSLFYRKPKQKACIFISNLLKY